MASTTSARPVSDASGGAVRVSTLELFFDLVFVFTITQLTKVIAEHPDWTSLLRVVVMLVVIFYMYGGYVWLTNAVAPDRAAYQVLLLGGMASFLVVSLAVPTAFEGGGLAFGLGYLAVVAIHFGMFTLSRVAGSARAIWKPAVFNGTAALLLVAAGLFDHTTRDVLWALAVVAIVVPPLRRPDPRFNLAPNHFVERHGLVVIVALGESVVAVGIGAGAHALDLGLVAVAVLGLSLSACLWWAYFAEGEDERALAAMAAADGPQRGVLALRGFYYCHLGILLGIVAVAAALEHAIGHPVEHLSTARALALGAGAALFLVSDVLFRRTLDIGRSGWRTAGAVLALATIPLGTEISGLAQLLALAVALVACLGAELAGLRRAHRSAAGQMIR